MQLPLAVQLLLRQLPDAAVVPVVTLGKLGHLRPGPGTWGSAVGVLVYTVLFYPLPFPLQILLLAPFLIFCLLWCEEGERRLGHKDPSELILDEVAGQQLAFFGLGSIIHASNYPWAYFLAGFALFRFFDILKPLGIKRLQNFPGGMGVLVDDLVAGLAAAVCLGLAHFYLLPLVVE
ncbi:MAG: phosphatidylglycerophosphatase A [Verrucomicrobiota bacterium JB022]|nr:phosphatidylglycerophosphatase A [Verrucomicrobiota bacterium JB022]